MSQTCLLQISASNHLHFLGYLLGPPFGQTQGETRGQAGVPFDARVKFSLRQSVERRRQNGLLEEQEENVRTRGWGRGRHRVAFSPSHIHHVVAGQTQDIWSQRDLGPALKHRHFGQVS